MERLDVTKGLGIQATVMYWTSKASIFAILCLRLLPKPADGLWSKLLEEGCIHDYIGEYVRGI